VARKTTKPASKKRTRKTAATRTPASRTPARKTSGAFAKLKVSDSFRAFVLAQLEALGDVTARAMFGGVGLYRRGVFFGIVAADVLYFKVDDRNRPDYERYDAKPFQPYANRPSTNYFAVPTAILESSDDLTAWARKSLKAAARA
jgi:DNA transformation protein and related proteins